MTQQIRAAPFAFQDQKKHFFTKKRNQFIPSRVKLYPLNNRPSDWNVSRLRPISLKLSQELEHACQHMQSQKSRTPSSPSLMSFSTQPCPFEIKSYEDHIPYEVGIAHAQGKRPTMEDEHIAALGTVDIDGKSVPYQLFGIIDGHGGNETALFVKQHVQKEIEKAIQKHKSSQEGIWKALKEAAVQTDALAHTVGDGSGAVAVLSLKIGDDLWTANIGDCRAILKVGDQIIQLSEDAKPDTPRFQRGIEKRGGWVEKVYEIARVNGILACARAFGDLSLKPAVAARPKITKVDLSQYLGQQIHLIQACDGIWDVASSKEAGSIIGAFGAPKEGAAALLRAALNAGSSDNCSALVARLS